MHFNKLSDDLSVSPQIVPAEMAAIKAAGYKSIICNRPDGESADQPTFSQIGAAAKAAGLTARYLPIVPGGVSSADSEAFAGLMAQLPKPVLAFCRSGMRSSTLWSMSQRQKHSHSATASATLAGTASRLRRLLGQS